MRPRLQDRGDEAAAGRSFRFLVASMRPRLQDRGDSLPLDLNESRPEASMRPRLQDRGDFPRRYNLVLYDIGFNAATAPRPWRLSVTGRGRKPNPRLQCGHGSKTVEIRPREPSRCKARSRLQCGHGSKTVEMTHWSVSSPQTFCFNAATAPRPWRSASLFGPPVRLRSCFNAATAPRPWRSKHERTSVRTVCSFNAATAPRPWRYRN